MVSVSRARLALVAVLLPILTCCGWTVEHTQFGGGAVLLTTTAALEPGAPPVPAEPHTLALDGLAFDTAPNGEVAWKENGAWLDIADGTGAELGMRWRDDLGAAEWTPPLTWCGRRVVAVDGDLRWDAGRSLSDHWLSLRADLDDGTGASARPTTVSARAPPPLEVAGSATAPITVTCPEDGEEAHTMTVDWDLDPLVFRHWREDVPSL